MDELITRVERTIIDQRLFSRSRVVLVGVSGGLDSMVLLHLLHQLASKHRWKIIVAHLNHRLRGKHANADERFVANAARRLGLRCITAKADVQGFAREKKLSLEMAARKIRHDFFVEAAHTVKASTVALGQHADDQVELFLLRALRGAGASGLAGMRVSAPFPSDSTLTIVRPLLDVLKAELLRYARAHKIRFREDASNFSTDILRNRVRHTLLPLLRREYQPGIDAILLRTREILRADDALIEDQARAWRQTRKPAFDGLPVALQRRVLQAELLIVGIVPEFELVERLRNSDHKWTTASNGMICRSDLNGRIELRVEPRALESAFRDGSLQITLHKEIAARFGGVDCAWRTIQGAMREPPVPHREFFDAAAVGDQITLRHWRPGDRFQPIGLAKPTKLQDLFVNQKIPRDHRRRLVVATVQSGDIFWVEGLRIGDRFKIKRTTQHTLEWRWHRAESQVAAPKTGC